MPEHFQALLSFAAVRPIFLTETVAQQLSIIRVASY